VAHKQPGADTLAEILSQPACWARCLDQLAGSTALDNYCTLLNKSSEVLFIGCGSSYYLALAAAATWSEVTGMSARALPASELLLYPELALDHAERPGAVVFSRSGRTSEALQAATMLSERRIPTLGISCATGQKLETLVSRALVLPEADENSTVMTRSFTSMLIALQYLAANFAGDMKMAGSLRMLPHASAGLFLRFPRLIQEFVEEHRFNDYVCLSQGPVFGLACKSSLKVTEMSCSYGQTFHTLEFRHGPKSIVGPETLITFLLTGDSKFDERAVLEEIKGLGGTTLVVCNQADERSHANADLLLELCLDLPELARLAPYVAASQLLGLYTGLKKGLDPDNPRNLSRVVVLDGDEADGAHAPV
jgi:glucosamine--fructose-6-phosphate aminotransferase (isomerizing)